MASPPSPRQRMWFIDYIAIVVGFLAAIVNGGLMSGFALILGNLFDTLNSTDPTTATRIAVWFTYLAVVAFVCSFLQSLCLGLVADRFVLQLRKDFCHSLLRQDCAFFDEPKTASLTAQSNESANTINEAVAEKLGQALQFLSSFIVGIAVGFAYVPSLAGVIIALLPLVLITSFLMVRSMQSSVKNESEAYKDADTVVQEGLENIRTLASYGLENKFSQFYAEKLQQSSKETIKQGISVGLGFASTTFIYFVSFSIAFWYGSVLIVNSRRDALGMYPLSLSGVCQINATTPCHFPGASEEQVCMCPSCRCGCFGQDGATDRCVSGGDVLITFFAVLIGAFGLGQLGPAISTIIKGRHAYLEMDALIRRVSTEMIAVSKSALSEQPSALHDDDDVVFDQVTFAYPNRPDHLVFQNLSMRVPANKRTGIVGTSGSGKSTVFQLIERFYDVQVGSIRMFGGLDIRQIDLQLLRKKIGYVNQEPILFSGTIEDNIRLGMMEEAVSLADIERVCKIANASGFIETFPLKYKTVVGGSGTFSLSGGQKARISIARALLRDPSLLLFDESTASLDSINEREVNVAIDAILSGVHSATTIIVAHRMQSVRRCDKIIVLKDGQVAEQGTHEELVAKGETYATLLKLSEAHRHQHTTTTSNAALTSTHPEVKQARLPKPTNLHHHSVPSFNQTGFEHAAKDRLESIKKDEGNNNTKDVTFSRVFEFARPDLILLVCGVLACIVSGASMPAFALLLSRFMEVFFLPDTNDLLAQARLYSLLFLLIAFIQSFATLLQATIFGYINARISSRVRLTTFTHLLRMEMNFFDEEENSLGILASKLASEASKLKGAVSDRFQTLAMNISSLTVGLIVAFIASWKLTLVVLSLFPVVLLSVLMRFGMMRQVASKDSNELVIANGAILEAVRGIKTVKAFTAEDSIEHTFLQHISKHIVQRQRSIVIEALGVGFSMSVVFLCYSLAFYYGSQLVANGEISFEQLNQALFGVLMSARALGMSSALAPDMSRGQSAANVIFHILDRPSRLDPESTAGLVRSADVEPGRGVEIEFNEIEFAFPTRPSAKVLHDLSFLAEPGSTVALVGKSGSGKTASLQLLERFYDPDEGSIRMDQDELRDLNLKFLRSRIGFIPQEPTLFDVSILENIRMGNESATDEECMQAAQMAYVNEFIESVGGYGVKCGRKGVFLSGGQKQRVAIARALVRKPKVLLGDELSSAMDEDLQAKVLESLRLYQQREQLTVFLVAHRLSTIAKADKIFVFDAGTIIESGTFDELKDNETGAFRSLMNAQLGY